MRKYLHINLVDRSISAQEFHGEQIVRAGRYFIAKSLLESDVAAVDPLGPDNPLSRFSSALQEELVTRA